MMETKEIVHSLRCCISAESCDSCDFFGIQRCVLSLKKIAANRLEELEAEIAELKKHLSEKPEWISVEDRLPEEKVYCLTAVDGGDRAHFSIFMGEGFSHDDSTHWMPLPEPPKPKEPSFKDVFLKAFPKAEKVEDRPALCVHIVFPYVDECEMNGEMRCKKCWNQPYFEEEGEADA